MPEPFEDNWHRLRPEYIAKIAKRGDGRRMPSEYADKTMTRLYFPGDEKHTMYVEHYSDAKMAYQLYLGFAKGVRCAMRNANEELPVYNHDLVDRR